LERIPRLALLRGEALLAASRHGDAEATLLAAHRGSAHQGARPLLWRIHSALGRLYLAQRRAADAAAEFEHARTIIAQLAATIADARIQESFQDQALARLPQPSSARRQAAQVWGGLSRREREVATLIAQGKSNSEIADALVVGKRTVETHVGSIFSKLGLTRRAQIVAWVLAQEQVGTDG
jgi:DNA-binding NarL/FixJ family response regulator